MNTTIVWPTLRYTDARAAIRFLVDLGFEERAVYGDGDRVDHAELRWRSGGGVMLGSAQRDESAIAALPPDTGSVYIVIDDPDELFECAVRLGATVVQPLRDEDYGSRGFTVQDPAGVLWSFGTYGGAESP